MAGPSGVPVFERFFRSVAQLKVDKSDVKRFREFVDEMVDDIAIAGRNSARWNDRDVIAPMDLPITKGLQERMREFDKLDEAVDIRAVLAAGRAPTACRRDLLRGDRGDAAGAVRRPEHRLRPGLPHR